MSTQALQLRPLLAELVRAVVPPEFSSADDIHEGIRQLEAVVLRVGVEAHDANMARLSYSQAAGDFANFPLLHKVHFGVRDLLTVVLEHRVADHMEKLLAMPSPPIAEDVLLALGRMAGSPTASPVLAAAAQFWLLQAVRLNVMVAEMLDDSTIAEVGGLPRDLDDACEDEVRWWITEGIKYAGDVQPLRILVASALKKSARQAS